MADEIKAIYNSGYTLYGTLRDGTGLVWYVAGQVFETWGTGGRTASDYAIIISDASGNLYLGDFDTNVDAGIYSLIIRQQTGGSPADSDPVATVERSRWTGTEWKGAISYISDVAA